jgi:serine/threonine-protein kinase
LDPSTIVEEREGLLDPGASLPPGTTAGEYVIEQRLGRGSYGTVYRARQPVIGKVVAIKVLSAEHAFDANLVSRFIAEARAVNQIRHRNIIDIFSFGKLEDGRHYYVMEHLKGVNLAEHLRRRGRLSLAEAVEILRPIADALDAAHAAGIIHRDVKPANVFLATDFDGTRLPKLLDFGLVKRSAEDGFKTVPGRILGTPNYMSPEQCLGASVDRRTDIYSFGAMAYEMLVGHVPFSDETLVEVIRRTVEEEASFPSMECSDLTVDIDRAIMPLLAKDPAARPPSAAFVVGALERAALSATTAHAPSANAPSLAIEESPIARERRGARSFVIAAGLLLVVCAIAAALLLSLRAPPRAEETAPSSALPLSAPASAAVEAPPAERVEPPRPPEPAPRAPSRSRARIPRSSARAKPSHARPATEQIPPKRPGARAPSGADDFQPVDPFTNTPR